MKKLFTLLTLLVGLCTGAWGATVDIFKATATTAWSVPGGSSNADISSKATVIGGEMTVYNGQSSAKDMIVKYGKIGEDDVMAFQQTNGNTMFKVTLPAALAVGDIITVDVYSNQAERGIWLSTSEAYPSEGGKKINTTNNSAKAWETGLTYTLQAADEDLVGQTSFYIHRATSNSTYFANFKISRNISAPYIWKQPVGDNYEKDVAPTALSVTAIASTGELNYQWYSCNDTEKTGAAVIDGATNSSFAPSTSVVGDFYYYCLVSDEGSNTTASSVVKISITAAAAPTVSVESSAAAAVAKGTEVTLTATLTGTPAPTIQWYSNTENNNTSGTIIDGATSETYAPSTASVGTIYYYAIATNASGNATSNVVSVIVNASNKCQLTSIQFSNSAYGAIAEPVNPNNGTITVPYLSGQSAPTVVDASVEISADATYEVSGSTLTVTAEDGTTTATYDITTTAFTPLAVSDDIAETTFAEVPSWVYNPYGHDESKGVKFSKKVNEASNMRITKGFARQYYFISSAKNLILTSGSNGGRDIKVYRNGVELSSPTATAASNSTITIVLDPTAPCMIMIESNQTGGDGGFTKYAVTAAKAEPSEPVVDNVNHTVTLSTTSNMAGWRTYNNNTSNKYTVDGTTKVYYASATGDSKVTLTEIDGGVPANTVVILHQTSGTDITLTETASDITAPGASNLLKVSTENQNLGKVYRLGYKTANGVGFYTFTTTSAPAGIIYVNSIPGATARDFLGFDFGDDTTGVNEVRGQKEDVRGEYFNLAGQRVAQPTKGLYIVNGKKVILK